MSRKVTPTYTLLNQITLATDITSFTFANIPQNFTDLVLLGRTRSTRSVDAYDVLTYRFNGDTANNYSHALIAAGVGSGGVSESGASISLGSICRLNTSSGGNTVFGAFSFNVFDYSQLDKHKSTLGRGGSHQEAYGPSAYTSRWASLSAVTSITLGVAQGNQLASGSTFSLYGVIG